MSNSLKTIKPKNQASRTRTVRIPGGTDLAKVEIASASFGQDLLRVFKKNVAVAIEENDVALVAALTLAAKKVRSAD